ncbi:ABC transporter ATP-binding protein [Actinoplanes xinjiangensis]|uniref:ATP-binding cassette subfamily B protein n=1 Tax=Actinoplanes xinjiangensis TaxID=512350 RepID=A0A316ETN1_9ACTN|nr:ABC transporter ATP-binding protein [Actinoplanes xinjiangensis]PWK36097.1 ATP-binding cassette subfamily B protein [Actinoplanes xinjiangensis]GIF42899.1 hypothetical protein Axi01nite_72100 [Actinoplanes xinjiangensis]
MTGNTAAASWREIADAEWALLSGSRRHLAVWAVLLTTASLCGVAAAVLLGRFVNEARQGRVDAMLGAALAMGGLMVISALARTESTRNIEVAIAAGVARLRLETFALLQHKDIPAMTKLGLDEIYHRLTDGITAIREAMRLLLSDFAFNVVAAMIGLLVVVRIDPLIPVICGVVYLPYIVVRRRLMFRLGQHWNGQTALYPAIGGVIREAVEGVRTVKNHAATDIELAKLDRAQDAYLGAVRRHLRALGVGGFLNHVMFLVPEGLVYLYLGRHVMRGDASIGDLLTVVALFPFFRQVIWHASRMAAHRHEHGIHLARLADLRSLRDAAHLSTAHLPARSEALRGEVELRQVSVNMDGQAVLYDVDLVLEPGSRLGVVGLSGAGKSTIANLLIGLIQPDTGVVLVDGRPLHDWDIDDLRQQISYITQEIFLLNGTVRDNLTYGVPVPRDERLWEVLGQADLIAFVRGLPEQLDTVIGERGVKLSGGERQRLSIARAYLRDPRILVLDETTSALDSDSERRVREAQDRLAAGRTVMVIAHRLITLRHCDRILVVENGRVAEQGRHDELLAASGTYARLHRSQFSLAPERHTS